MHPSCRVVQRIGQDFRGFVVSGEGGDPCAGGHGRDRFVLRLRELLSHFRGNFIAFKGINSPSQAAYGPEFSPLRKRDSVGRELTFCQ